MDDEKQCQWCVHYRAFTASMAAYVGEHPKVVGLCTLDRPLVPCEFYEREPGADDE